MIDVRRIRLGDVTFEYKERIGEPAPNRPVYGVDKSVGLTAQPRYQASDLSRYKRIENGMFAYNPMRLNIGSIGFCHDGLAPGIVSPDYVVFACRQNDLLPEFLDYHRRSAPWAQWLTLAGEGSVRERIYFRKLATYELLLPNLAYQEAAVRILAAIDQKILLNRRMNETLEAISQAIFKDWFVDFGPTRRKLGGATTPVAIMGGLISDAGRATQLAALFPDNFDSSGLPSGWREVPLSQVCEINPREPMKKGQVALYSNMASLPTCGPTADAPSLRAFGSGMRFRNGDALLARITPCLENGKAAFVDFLRDGQVGWGSTEFIVLRAKPPIPPQFSYLVIRHPDFKAYAVRSMTGTSGRQRAQEQSVGHYNICYANEPIYRALGQFLKPLFEKISVNARETRTLAETRDFLLPRFMSGEVHVHDSERLVESATA